MHCQTPALVVALVLGILFAHPSQAAGSFLAAWNNGSAVELDDAVADARMFRGPGVTDNNGSNFGSRGWTTGSLSNAIAASDYVSFFFEVAEGFEVEITEFDLGVRRSSTGADDISLVLWRGNAGASPTLFSYDFRDSSAGVQLRDRYVTNSFRLTGDVELRLYGYRAESSLGSLTIEPTISRSVPGVTGTLAAGAFLRGNVYEVIPTPGAAIPLLLACSVIMPRRRCAA